MKGIILAGGFGTRLYPITKVTNKHLLPVYHKPMIFYPIETMVKAGINRIIIVTNPSHVEDFVNLLGSGKHFKDKRGKRIQIVYAIQDKPSGIADGLWIAKDYIGQDNCLMILGDNLVLDDLTPHLKNFTDGALIFVKEVEDPHRFGIAEIDGQGNVVSVEEKPTNPRSNLAITGIYVYDNSCFQKCIGQPKSARGEYEITYINNLYLKEGQLKAVKLTQPWFDAGTIDSLLEASIYVKHHHATD